MKNEDTKTEEEPPIRSEIDTQANNPTPIQCNTATLFVGGLHPRVGDLHLQKLFAPYGSIIRIHLVTHKPGASPSYVGSKSKTTPKHTLGVQQSKGYAFVEYGTVESARMAMSRLNGKCLLGKNLSVRPAKRQKMDGANNDSERVVTAEEAKQQCRTVQSKIDLLKKTIEQKKKGL